MAEIRGFAVCPECCGVYLASQQCEPCGRGKGAGVGQRDRDREDVAIAVDLPLRGTRLRAPRLGRRRWTRRPVVPGRFGWLREHAAVAVLAGLSLVLFALAGVLSSLGPSLD